MKLLSFFPVFLILFFATDRNQKNNEFVLPPCDAFASQNGCCIVATASAGYRYYVFGFTGQGACSGQTFKSSNVGSTTYSYCPASCAGTFIVEIALCNTVNGQPQCCFASTSVTFDPALCDII
jgi:hypothetical protein